MFGACFLTPASDYWSIGGMDEQYFLHVEDVDFCLRFADAGGGVYFDPTVSVLHFKSSSDIDPIIVDIVQDEYKDLIDFDSDLFLQVNRGQVDTSGVEIQGDWTASDSLRLQGHATYTDIDVQDDTATLLGRPEWTAGATGIWQISTQWRFALDYQWTGEQNSSSRHTGENVVETLDDFHQWDANLAWQPRDWLAVELAMDNMLDDDSETAVGFKVPGRSVRVALVLSN